MASAQPADSLANTQPPLAMPPAVPTTAMSIIQGCITDSQGRPLPGVTVLAQATQQVLSTNANGFYQLTVPLKSSLQFGYGGYVNQLQHTSGASTVNVVLLPGNAGRRHRQK